MRKLSFYKNPIFWTGVAALVPAGAYILFGTSPEPSPFSLADVSLGSDGRCTGFPNSFLKWDWSVCCQVHDLGGSDGDLAKCILERTPVAATPLVFFSLALMAFCRPIYNLLQRAGLVK